MEEIRQQFEQALLKIDKIEARRLVEAVSGNRSPVEIISSIIVPSLENIGLSWQEGNVALSQIYLSGRICESLIDEILPSNSELRTSQPRMAIAVLNDYHLLGKRIVYSHLRSVGYDLIDYGRKSIDDLVAVIIKDNIQVILISALMYPSALNVRQVKDKLALIAPDVKIIVGGAPFNMDEKLWINVGADAMGRDGNEAILNVNKIMEAV